MANQKQRLAFELLAFAISQAALYFGIRYIMDSMDPQKDKKQASKQKGQDILKRIGRPDVRLDEYEYMVASNIIDTSSDIDTDWSDIGGLDSVIQSLKESVVFPFSRPDIFKGHSKLLQPPKGILLYGPPGCGKTMLAKAVAKASHCVFINVQMNSLTDKWFGESQKLVSALFSLARKLQPAIIFLDEADALLRNRASNDHEATAMMKAIFMSQWDGLTTDPDCRVIVMGATNRPYDVDKAFLRRMPQTFKVSLPNTQQREAILRVLLKSEPIDDTVNLQRLAEQTERYSGSALSELCRNAAMYVVREYMAREGSMDPPELVDGTNTATGLRPLSMKDFEACLQTPLHNGKSYEVKIPSMPADDLD
eukprot:Clim_evm10s225 gene=Clim_evmTU10s225